MDKEKKISAAAAVIFASAILIFALLNIPHLKTPLYTLLTGQTDLSGFTQLVHESYVNDTVGRYGFVDLNGLFMRLTGRRTDNSVMKLKNGMLTEENTPECDVTELSGAINSLAEYVDGQGMGFMYIQLPYKLDLNSELVIEGRSDHSNENADKLLADLDESVDVLDLRQLLCRSAEDIERNFFRTDHHWNYYGAFRGFSEILRQLDARFPDCGIDLSCGDIDNWESHTVGNWMLGSRGRRTGRYFGGLDDMTYYTPKFEMEISCEIPETGEYYKGDFAEANIRTEKITGDRDLYEKNAYCLYIGNDYGYIKQRNTGAAGKLRILLIKESFSLPLQAYLSTAVEYLDSVDPRYLENVTVKDIIDEVRPDMVLLALNPNVIPLCPEAFSHYGIE